MDIIIRKFKQPDFDGIVELWKKVLPDSKPHNDPVTSLEKKIAQGDNLLLVADIDNDIVGTVMGGYDGHRGWIYSVAVLPEFRSKKIGTMLLDRMEKDLAVLGCQKVNLQVRSANADVVQFYRKCGFEVEEIISMGKRLY